MNRILIACLCALMSACVPHAVKQTVATAGKAERLVYSSYRPAGWDIYLYEGQGRAPIRLTDHPALDYSATLSADGRWVVFTSERGGNPSLFVIDRQTQGAPRLLVRSDAMQDQATLSPDGKWLAFVSTHGGDADIYRLPFRPDATQDITGALNLTHHAGGDFRPAFSPDSQSIAFSSDRDGTSSRHPVFSFSLRNEGDVYLMSSAGDDVRRLTTSPGWDGSPAWSEDGKRLYFYGERDKPDTFRIYSVGVDGRDERPVGPDGVSALSPATGRGEALLLSTVVQNGPAPGQGRWQVTSLAADGALADASDPSMDCLDPDLHRASGVMVCHGGPPLPEGKVANFAGPLLVDGDPHAVTLPDRTLAMAGARQAFTTPLDPMRDELVFRSSPRKVSVASAKGEGPSALLDIDDLPGRPAGSVSHLRYTRDGQWVSFTVGPFAGPPGAEADVWRMRADGSEPANLTPGTPGNDGLAEFSADGRRFVFRSGRGGSFHLYLGTVDGAPPRRLTDGAGNDTFPAISPRGDQVAFVSDRNGTADKATGKRNFDVYTMDLAPDGTPGEVRQVTRDSAQTAHVGYSPDGAWLVYTSGKAGWADEAPLVQQVLFNPQMYGEIYAYRLADGLSVRLTHNKWEDGAPVWTTSSTAAARPPVADALADVIGQQGADAALATYRRLQGEAPMAYRFGEGGLFALAERFLEAKNARAAADTYVLLSRLQPASPKPSMALGDALFAQGDNAAAADAYRDALRLQPDALLPAWSLFRSGAEGHAEVSLPPTRAGEYTGRYQHPEFGFALEFGERDGTLTIMGPGQPAPWPLAFVGDDHFYLKPQPGEVRFVRSPDGKVIAVEARNPGMPLTRLTRVD